MSTFAGPSTSILTQPDADAMPTPATQQLATQRVGAGLGASAVPFNSTKAAEHGLESGHRPVRGEPVAPHNLVDMASSVTEGTPSAKLAGLTKTTPDRV